MALLADQLRAFAASRLLGEAAPPPSADEPGAGDAAMAMPAPPGIMPGVADSASAGIAARVTRVAQKVLRGLPDLIIDDLMQNRGWQIRATTLHAPVEEAIIAAMSATDLDEKLALAIGAAVEKAVLNQSRIPGVGG